jgi:hypothetical protein
MCLGSQYTLQRLAKSMLNMFLENVKHCIYMHCTIIGKSKLKVNVSDSVADVVMSSM